MFPPRQTRTVPLRHSPGQQEQIGQESAEERVSAILENEGTEGLRDAMQRERDKYASLPEMRPALEETQMRG